VWELAERFGWSLEYIEGLPMERLHEWFRILDGRNKGIAERHRREKFLRGKKGK
jgi:hypothetical protein